MTLTTFEKQYLITTLLSNWKSECDQGKQVIKSILDKIEPTDQLTKELDSFGISTLEYDLI